MITAFSNAIRVPELRQRIFFTLAVLIVVRLGAAVTCPGVNAAVLQAWFDSQLGNDGGGGVAALLNIFSGGALENCAVFSLGVMPYISASIMLQLLTAVVPRLGKMAREEGGRQKIMQLTRYATIGLCIFQGYLLALSFESPESSFFLRGIEATIARMGGVPLVSDKGFIFRSSVVISLTAGSMFLMWLGDRVTEGGIGNGMSVVISVGILARLPAGLVQAWADCGTEQVAQFEETEWYIGKALEHVECARGVAS